MYRLLLIAFILLLSGRASAQLTLSGEIRPRGELRHGYKSLADDSLKKDPAVFVSQRTRLNLEYKASRYTAFISGQDVRTWGDQVLKEDVPAFALYQAWIKLKVADSIDVKIGRQEWIYDNERLLSINNWNQNGQVHDGVLFRFLLPHTSLDAGTACNMTGDPLYGNDYTLASSNYKTLSFFWLTHKLGKHKIQLTGIGDSYQKSGTKTILYIRYTAGGGADINTGKVSIQGRFHHQFGKTQEGFEISANQWMLEITDTLSSKFHLTAGFDWLSGTDATDTLNDKVNAFNPLYTSGHRYQGSMDYFTSPLKNTKGAGLMDGYLRLTFKAGKTHTFFADYHWFSLQNKYISGNEEPDPFLAHEIDLKYVWKPEKELNIEIGYSHLLPGKSMEEFFGGDSKVPQYWFYTMITVKPVFK